MKTQKLYKILVDQKSCHGGDLVWDLPKKVKGKWVPGQWHEISGDLKICHTGLHLTTQPFDWYKWGCVCYEAEAREIVEWQEDKCVAHKVRLLKEVPHPQWWTKAERFVNLEIKNINWLKPDRNPLKSWKVFYGKSWAAAWDAARAAAGDAAWGAARGAAWGADWDAGLYVQTEFVCEGTNLPKKHIKHARDRMKVWRKGYALRGDVNGVLYVYAPEKYRPKNP